MCEYAYSGREREYYKYLWRFACDAREECWLGEMEASHTKLALDASLDGILHLGKTGLKFALHCAYECL